MTESAIKRGIMLDIDEEVHDDAHVTASILIDRQIVVDRRIDPIEKIFVSVRKKYNEDRLVTILSPSKGAAGLDYKFYLANVQDGMSEDEIDTALREQLAIIKPQFEERLKQFFELENGYQEYVALISENKIEEAKQAISNFIYEIASKEERKHIDEKAKEEAKRAKETEAARHRFLGAFGTSALASLSLTLF